ncbi:MAG: phosphatidylglycerol lysyltransferase domain-containing protein [Candidatus Woesearchaeota archaeon]
MKVIYDVAKHQKKIKKSIRKYGFFAEHNCFHYLYNESKLNKNIFFDFGRDKLLLAQFNKNNNIWSLFPEGILAPEKERLELLLEAADYILKKQKAKKFVVELSEDIRKRLLNKFRARNSFRACNYNYILYWPMYNLDLWNPKLKGSKLKKLRNVRNRFYKINRVRVKDSKDVPKEELKRILLSWFKKRNCNDRVNRGYYSNLVDNNFKGADMAKTLYVNGKPCTITAGWKIPNSNNYYSSIGILDYSYPGLGEAANIDDLNRLKRKGYDYADFGGSDRALLYFKKKFRPEKIYKTYIFSIVRR